MTCPEKNKCTSIIYQCACFTCVCRACGVKRPSVARRACAARPASVWCSVGAGACVRAGRSAAPRPPSAAARGHGSRMLSGSRSSRQRHRVATVGSLPASANYNFGSQLCVAAEHPIERPASERRVRGSDSSHAVGEVHRVRARLTARSALVNAQHRFTLTVRRRQRITRRRPGGRCFCSCCQHRSWQLPAAGVSACRTARDALWGHQIVLRERFDSDAACRGGDAQI